MSKSQVSISTRLVLAAGLALWGASALILWLSQAPLGHDEAQYALGFQGMLRDGPVRWIYLSKGMHAVVAPGYWAGGSELALRALPMACGLGFALAVTHLAWRVFGATTAAWTLLVLATAKPLVRRSVDLLSDFPSAALLVWGTTIVLLELTGGRRARGGDAASDADAAPGAGAAPDAGAAPGAGAGADAVPGPSWRLALAAPIFAAAFYLRYASCVPIALVGGAALLVGWRQARRRPAPVIGAALLLLLLLVPHFADAIALTGSPLGILLESQRVPQAEVSGLRTYLTSNPLSFYGFAVTPALVLGVLSLLRWRREAAPAAGAGPAETQRRRALALWIIGVADIIALGLTALGQARYILLGIALLVILGVELTRGLVAGGAPRLRRAAVVALALGLGFAALLSVSSLARQGHWRRRAYLPQLMAADVIRRDAEGKPCHFAANHYTQIEWYSGCDGHDYPQEQALAEGHHVYYVRDDSPGWQPSPAELAQPHVVLLEDRRYQLLVIRLVPPPPGAAPAPVRL